MWAIGAFARLTGRSKGKVSVFGSAFRGAIGGAVLGSLITFGDAAEMHTAAFNGAILGGLGLGLYRLIVRASGER